MNYKNKKAFTLVELVIVMIILIIISTIWFLSYVQYLEWARDSNRITQLKWIHDLLEIEKTKTILPYPDNKINIQSNWSVIWYQWYAWEDVLERVEFSKWWVDPKDKVYFTYYLTQDRKTFQLLWHLEDFDNLLASAPFVWKANAADAVDYSKRYVTVVWKRIWIITDTLNSPAQELSSIQSLWYLDLTWSFSWTTFLSHLSDWIWIQSTWLWISYILLTNSSSLYDPPSTCGPWYIPVPWNAEFNQKWFCVAKYEMTYENWSWTPDSTDGSSSWNSYAYNSIEYISPKKDYPITWLSQSGAIDACNNIWKWYHLITDNEWLTIARDVEFEDANWSNGLSWDGYIFAWNTNDVSWTIGCSDWTWPRTKATLPWDDKPWLTFERSTCDEKRQLVLSNGEVIWDFAWNVAEHVNKSNIIDWTWYSSWATSASSCSPSSETWVERTTCWDMHPSDSTWDSSFGIWMLDDTTWTTSNIYVRWWKYWDIEKWWIYSLSLWETDISSSTLWWIGFRCAK